MNARGGEQLVTYMRRRSRSSSSVPAMCTFCESGGGTCDPGSTEGMDNQGTHTLFNGYNRKER